MTKTTEPSEYPNHDGHGSIAEDHRSEEEILAQRAETPEEQSELSALLREIHGGEKSRSSWLKRFGWVVAAITFTTLGILTAVLIREVQMSTRIYGPSTLIPGQQASFRISVFDPEKTSFHASLTGEMWLLDHQRKHLLYRGKTSGSVLIANIQAPTWPPGTHYRLRVTVRCPQGTETITRPIHLQPSSLAPSGYAPMTNKTAWELPPLSPHSPYRVLLFSENRAPVADVLTTFWLHIREQHVVVDLATSRPSTQPIPRRSASSHPTAAITSSQPSSRPTIPSKFARAAQPITRVQPDSHQPRDPFAPTASPPTNKPSSIPPGLGWNPPRQRLLVHIQHGKSSHSALTPDALGFVQFPYVPQLFDEPWQVSLQHQNHRYDFGSSIKPEGYQLVLDLPRVVQPQGQPLSLRVDGLYAKGEIHVDITQAGRILSSYQGYMSGGRVALQLQLPPHIQGLIGVQVYSEFYFPGEIHDERLVFIGSPQRKELFASLRKHLIQRGDVLQALVLDSLQRSIPPHTPLSQWVRPVFALCKARFVSPQLFYDSGPQRLRNLRRYQQQFRFSTIVFLIGMSGCILLVLFVWVYLDHQRDLKRVLAVEDSPHITAIHAKKLPYLFAFLLLLAAFFAAIILLFWAMQWTYDHI